MRNPHLAQKAKSETVLQVQTALLDQRLYTAQLDGVFGRHTEQAVKDWQIDNAHEPTGRLDESQLLAIDHAINFSLFRRCLAVIAAWEHALPLNAYKNLYGDFDGAILTYGIIGMTWGNGELPNFLLKAHSLEPAIVEETFGPHSDEFLHACELPDNQRDQYARDKLLLGKHPIPWVEHVFRALGDNPVIRNMQIDHARKKYWEPACNEAQRIGFTSSNGYLLCFDAAVQGGFSAVKAYPTYPLPNDSALKDLAQHIFGAVNPRWQDDKRSRSLCAATGSGKVHDREYDLTAWGFYSLEEINEYFGKANTPSRNTEPPSAEPEPSINIDDILGKLRKAQSLIHQARVILEKQERPS